MSNRNTEGQFTMQEQDNLIGLVYEAVLKPSLWPQLLEQMGHYLNALPVPDDDTVVLDGHAHNALASHFKRAVKIQQKISGLESITHAFSDILNRLPIGVMLVRHDASVVASNDLADTLLDETGHLLFHNHQLQANSLANTRALHAMIREAVSGHLDEPISMSIGSAGEETSVWVAASSSIHVSLQSGNAMAAVFIHSPRHQRQIPLAAFAAKYQLSRAETRLAKAMLNGCHTLNHAAEHMGLSKHTVRAQMKSIFSKTDTGGQIELMKKMLTGPSALISEQSSAASLAQLKDHSEKNPAASLSMCLHDGRRLVWREYGAPHGKPVMVFHSLTGAHPDYDIAKGMGLRLIVPERPGAHGSDPLPGRTFMDWPDDVSQLADYLRLDTFSLLGYSAGTPYVLACVDKIPHRIRNISLVSSMAPVRSEADLTGMIPLNYTAMRLGHKSPDLMVDFMRVFLQELEQNPDSYFTNIAGHQPDTDRAVLHGEQTKTQFMQAFQAAAKENFQQLCDEIALCASDWPTDLRHFQGQVSIWHGLDDPLVPVVMGKRIAAMVEQPKLYFIEAAGNYLAYSHWDKILLELEA